MTIISYAQNFEDVRLWRAFRDVSPGRYLDIGTQDPVRDSVSLAFYERGWRGVHVEPTPTYAAAMRAARPDETVIEAAVSTSPGPIRFFEIPETGLSTGTPDIAERHISGGWSCREIIVPTVTLAGIFDLMGPEVIHWMKIDVEGMEAEVLESWGDHPARPAALVIEATAPGTQTPTHESWHGKVTQRGYSEVAFDGLSRFFIHDSHAVRGEALALSPNVFDGYQILEQHFTAGHLWSRHETELSGMRQEIEASRLETAHQQQLLVEETRAHAATREAADSTVAAIKVQIAETNTALAGLEMQLAEQAKGHAAALSAADIKVATAERSLADAQAALSDLEVQLVTQANQHANALSAAELQIAAAERKVAETSTRHEALLQDHLSIAREVGRLEGHIAAQHEAFSQRLADAAEERRQLVEAIAEVTAEREKLQSALAEAEALAKSQIEQAASLAARNDELERARDAMAAERDSERQHRTSDALEYGEKLGQLAGALERRERQLRAATTLLESIPHPLAGLPAPLGALVRRWRGASAIEANESHRKSLEDWRRDLNLPTISDVSEREYAVPVSDSKIPYDTSKNGGTQSMETDAPITSVPQLLAPHDREFVHRAYQAVLGRAPDPAGEAYYLARIRAGHHKLAILKQLRRSPEGRRFVPGVAGLDRAIKRHVWTTLPFLGALLRVLWGAEGNGATHRALRMMANDIGRLRADQLRLQSEQTDLLALVRQAVQDTSTLRLATGAYQPFNAKAEYDTVVEVLKATEQAGANHALEAQLIDPLGDALSAAVKIWQGQTA